MPEPTHKKYLTLDQVADRFGISTKTVRRAISDSTISAVRVNRRGIRILESEAEKLARPIPTGQGE